MTHTNETPPGGEGLANASLLGADRELTPNPPEKQDNLVARDQEIISPKVDKKRNRITKTGLKDRRAALYQIVEKAKPCTVRQVFYLYTFIRIRQKEAAE